jgi:putative transposase
MKVGGSYFMQKKYLVSTNFQWQFIEDLFEYQRKPKWEFRKIWAGICYITKTGCQWRLLPSQFPPWQTVYWYFRKWTFDGVIEQIHNRLREMVRERAGKNTQPSVGIIDSASVRMSSISGHQRGIDGNKKIKGSKRHIITDTLGLIISLSIHAANIHDSKGAKQVIDKFHQERNVPNGLKKIYADGGYQGELAEYVKKKLNAELEIVKRNDKDRWEILPKRWVVERTFAWLLNFRRLVMDYERTIESGESFIYLAMIIIMCNRIENN